MSVFDGDVTENARGGKQSRTAGAFYQLPAHGLRFFRLGAKLADARELPIDSNDPYELAWFYLEELLTDSEPEYSLALAIYHLSCAIENFHTVGDTPTAITPGWHGIVRVAQVMEVGAKKYGRGNWRKIEYWSEIDHAVQHFIAYEAGDETAYKPAYATEYAYDGSARGNRVICNLWNALTRLVFAAETFDADYRFTDENDTSMVSAAQTT